MPKFEKSCYRAMLMVLALLLAETQVRAERCEQYIDLPFLNSTIDIDISPKLTWNSCRWIVSSPLPSRILVSCYPNVPESSGCSDHKISISRTGDVELGDAADYCTKEALTELSVDNAMVIFLGIGNINGSLICSIGVVEQVDKCRCGRRNTARIIGGVETGINEFPMMAALVKYSTKVIFCGATIVSEKYALTAAHCVGKGPPEDLGLLIGEHDHSQVLETNSSDILIIDRIIAHSGFNQKENYAENDIALVHTSDYILFNRNVGAVCIPFGHSRGQSFADEPVIALGWGQTQVYGQVHQLSNVLQKAEFTILDPSKCVSENALCFFMKGRGTCDHDPGGPVLWYDGLIEKVILLGIQSSSKGCGEIDNISTRVISYLDWIEENAPDASFCKKN